MKRRHSVWPARLLAMSLTVVESASAAVKVPDDLVGGWYGSYSSSIDRTHSRRALLTIAFQEAEYFEGTYSDGRYKIAVQGTMADDGSVIVTGHPPNPDTTPPEPDFGEATPPDPDLVIIGTAASF
jgi:hypothetical protein